MKKTMQWPPSSTPWRVGLISPCMGNLGNEALLSSMISNLSARIPGTEIVAFTMGPADTRARHGITTYPLAGTGAAHYKVAHEASPSGTAGSRAASTIKSVLKAIPGLRAAVRGIRDYLGEIGHFVGTAGVVRTLDCLIVPGGGALDEFWGGPWGHPWTLFKFALLSRSCRVPLLFVSVGKCFLKRPLSRFFVRTALRAAEYRSYRDQNSRDWAQGLLLAPGDPVVPDLAYSFTHASSNYAQGIHSSQGEDLLVGLSPIAYCDPRVWPIADSQRYNSYVRRIAEFATWLLRQGHRLMLFSTDSPDADTVNDVLLLMAKEGMGAYGVEILAAPPEQNAATLLSHLSKVDLVVASRLHGVILSHLIAKPALAISYDEKVSVHMRDIAQQAYLVDIDQVTVDALIQRFKVLKSARAVESAAIGRNVRLFRDQVDAQYDRLFGSPSHGKAQGALSRVTAPVLNAVGER